MKTIVDYNGNIFDSVKDMCEYHGVKRSTYYYRKEKLVSNIKESNPRILLKRKCIIEDHNGKRFKSYSDMARYYNIDRQTLDRRLNTGGWSMEKALTTPIRKYKCKNP